MEYRIDQCYDFPVDTTADVNEDFFRILQDGGREIRLLKLKYQIGRELPPVIRCRVKMLRGGEPVLSHIPAEHVFRLYGSRDWMHESYDFKVLRLPQGIGGFYELTDSNGIIFRLPSDDSRLTPGQNVRCRFERLTPGFFQLRHDREDEVLQFLTPDDIVSALNLPPVLGAFLRRYIPSLQPFAESMAVFRLKPELIKKSLDSIKNYTMMETAMSTPMHDAQRQTDTPRVLNCGHVRVRRQRRRHERTVYACDRDFGLPHYDPASAHHRYARSRYGRVRTGGIVGLRAARQIYEQAPQPAPDGIHSARAPRAVCRRQGCGKPVCPVQTSE